jgi:hypothetical protein
VIAFAFFFGCKETGERAGVVPEDELTVEQAQSWYTELRKSARTLGKNDDKVIWGAATQRKVADDDEIVVAPVLSQVTSWVAASRTAERTSGSLTRSMLQAGYNGALLCARSVVKSKLWKCGRYSTQTTSRG